MSDAIALKQMSGLELIQALGQAGPPQGTMAALMNITGLEAPEPGRVIFRSVPQRQHYNPIGTVHGGYAATMLDSAMGCAIHTLLPAGRAYTTLTLEIKYQKGMSDQTGEVIAEGRVVHLGGRQATAEASLRGPDGTLYATGTTTCMLFGERS